MAALLRRRKRRDRSGLAGRGLYPACPCMEGLQFLDDGSFVNPFSYAGGNGRSPDEAVIVLGIDEPMVFIKALHLWIHEHYSDLLIRDGVLDKESADWIRAVEGEESHLVAVPVEAPGGERSELFFDDSVLYAQSPDGASELRAAGPDASYDEIVARLRSGNLAVDFARLRTSFADSDHYDPDDPELREQFVETLRACGNGDWGTALEAAGAFLERCQASPFPHFLASRAYNAIGDCDRGTFHQAVADGLLMSTLTLKAGLSKKDAIEVLFIFEEYEFLSLMRLNPERQAITRWRGRKLDVLKVIEAGSPKRLTIYFDVTSMMSARERLRAS